MSDHHATPVEAWTAMIDDWLSLRGRGDQVLMLATERTTVAEINQLARAHLDARGDLPGRSRTYRAPDDRRAIPLAAGDRMIVRRNQRLTQPDGVTVAVRNGMTGRVVATRRRSLTVELDTAHRTPGGPAAITLPASYVGAHVDYGYARTVDTAQGATVDHSLFAPSTGSSAERAYVALSRGRLTNCIYATHDRAWIDAIGRGHSHALAVDQTPELDHTPHGTLGRQDIAHDRGPARARDGEGARPCPVPADGRITTASARSSRADESVCGRQWSRRPDAPSSGAQMPRIPHGKIVTPRQFAEAMTPPTSLTNDAARSVVPTDTQRFGYLFPTLIGDVANFLPESPATVEALKALGAAMEDDSAPTGDSQIPSVYTYFGQFVDHDITMEGMPDGLDPSLHISTADLVGDPGLTPLAPTDVLNALINVRSASLDLDSVYGSPAPMNTDGTLAIGTVSASGNRPPGKTDDNDLPRESRSIDKNHDRAALIGDPRNDENVNISQLHLAMLKAHNALVGTGMAFDDARTVLRQHYQYVVIHDFLRRRVAEPAVVDVVLDDGNQWYLTDFGRFYMPLEFAVAAYRFGHSMVRDTYALNGNFSAEEGQTRATLVDLFLSTAFSGQLQDHDTLPEDRIVEWERFVEPALENRARRIDTDLAHPGLFNLRDVEGQPDAAPVLSTRNLLRGYRLHLPTGQAVATLLGLPVLTPAELIAAAGSASQEQALTDGGFLDRTPLWYYVLAEAAHHHDGERLGPVGSTIIAEVLIGLIRHTDNSILRLPQWAPTLPAAGEDFELADLLRLAGVLTDTPPEPTTYTVQPGDTLFGIAASELGDGNRWPEIFLGNLGIIAHRNLITPGQVLVLPDAPADPPWRLYTVQSGDTLSSIAAAELGAAARFPEIAVLNTDIVPNPDAISPGQVLILPGA